MSLLTQVLAFEQIIKRAKDKRSAEMQILIGGIGVAIIPLSIAQHYTKSNPFGLRRTPRSRSPRSPSVTTGSPTSSS